VRRFSAGKRDKGALWAGQAGVETHDDCYGTPNYCGWQLTGEALLVEGRSRGVLNVNPTVAPHFDPVCFYLFGIDAEQPSINRRFLVSSITIGGVPQLAIEEPLPDADSAVLLSDAFNRSDEPIIVEWQYFSAQTLGAPLNIKLFNLNPGPIRVFATIWGNAIDKAFMNEADKSSEQKRLCFEPNPKIKYTIVRDRGALRIVVENENYEGS
jgi:hypothetical protein